MRDGAESEGGGTAAVVSGAAPGWPVVETCFLSLESLSLRTSC